MKLKIWMNTVHTEGKINLKIEKRKRFFSPKMACKEFHPKFWIGLICSFIAAYILHKLFLGLKNYLKSYAQLNPIFPPHPQFWVLHKVCQNGDLFHKSRDQVENFGGTTGCQIFIISFFGFLSFSGLVCGFVAF
jgi:hypothetical protein